MRLFDALELEWLKLYLDLHDWLDRKTSFGKELPRYEYDEKIFSPYVRVIAFIKQNYENKIDPEDYYDLQQNIEGLIEEDTVCRNKEGIVDSDKAVLAIIESQLRISSTKKDFIRILFNAADVNHDGYLQLTE